MSEKYVTVTVDLDEWDDDELIEELNGRNNGYKPLPVDTIKERGTALYYALQFKNDAEAMKIARQLAEDITGRII